MANIGFIGAGGIARAHAFSLNSLKYYYDDAPDVNFISVTSAREESRKGFAEKSNFNPGSCTWREKESDRIAFWAILSAHPSVFVTAPGYPATRVPAIPAS